jgi:hypothetical protein
MQRPQSAAARDRENKKNKKLAENKITKRKFAQTRLTCKNPLPSSQSPPTNANYDPRDVYTSCIKDGSLHHKHQNGLFVPVPTYNCPVCGADHI